MLERRPACWCGNADLLAFSPAYLRCPRCGTLVRADKPASAVSRVADDSADFYGRQYWFAHQERDLGCPNIRARARADLPDRCVYWLRTLLRYKRPPGRVLDLGSGPGGFVAMLDWAGFEATGLELSPWVVQFVRDTFHVPMLCGPIEDQRIEPASLDAIAMLDVLEHLPDPVATLRHCVPLLKPDGILLVQTPCYPEERSHDAMAAAGDRFLEMMKPPDHLHLLSRRAIREMLSTAGVDHVRFEPALFAEYDMFVVAGRAPLVSRDPAAFETALSGAPTARLTQALLDLDTARGDLARRYAAAEADREARFAALDDHGRRLGQTEGERNALRAELEALCDQLRRLEADNAARLAVIEAQGRRLAEAEADRTARLEVIDAQGRRLGEMEGERNALQSEVTALQASIEAIEADRAARLEVINEQAGKLADLDGSVHALRAEAGAQRAEIETQRTAIDAARADSDARQRRLDGALHELERLREIVAALRATRAYRVLRRLGRWQDLDALLSRVEPDPPPGPPPADAAPARDAQPTASRRG